MDPAEALRLAEEAHMNGVNVVHTGGAETARRVELYFTEAQQHLNNYREWRKGGGFEPPGGDEKLQEIQEELDASWEDHQTLEWDVPDENPMRAPSEKKLQEEFDLDRKDAKLIRKFAKSVDDPEKLEELVEKVPATDAYVRQMYHSPFDSHPWRVTVALHAIDQLVGGFGVEPLGPVEMRSGPPYQYINFGDTYATTLIYDRDKDELFIGNWGAIVEEEGDEWEENPLPTQSTKKLKAKLLR